MRMTTTTIPPTAPPTIAPRGAEEPSAVPVYNNQINNHSSTAGQEIYTQQNKNNHFWGISSNFHFARS